MLEHGVIDQIVDRREMSSKIANLLRLLKNLESNLIDVDELDSSQETDVDNSSEIKPS